MSQCGGDADEVDAHVVDDGVRVRVRIRVNSRCWGSCSYERRCTNDIMSVVVANVGLPCCVMAALCLPCSVTAALTSSWGGAALRSNINTDATNKNTNNISHNNTDNNDNTNNNTAQRWLHCDDDREAQPG